MQFERFFAARFCSKKGWDDLGIILSKRSVKIFINFALLLFMFFCIPQGVLCYISSCKYCTGTKSEGTKKLRSLLFLCLTHEHKLHLCFGAVFQFLNKWNAEEQSLLYIVSKVIDGTQFTSFNFSSLNKSFGRKKSCWFFVKANFSSICLQ